MSELSTAEWLEAFINTPRPLAEVADRSTIGPALALWPSPQIPASVRSVEDSRIIDIGRE